MKQEIKDKLIAFKVSENERLEIQQIAKDNGFRTVSGFIIWLIKKYGKKQE
jgi:hypothetical protein